jgi:putative aminopeptidase FrvX
MGQHIEENNMADYNIDISGMMGFLLGLLNIYSPTGDTERAVAYVRKAFELLGLETTLNAKGAFIATWKGRSVERPRALTAHVDTLGAMVKEIKPNGRLRLTQLGSYAWNTVEGEGCFVRTATGATVSGTILPTKVSVHVHSKEVSELERKEANMEVRLDARTTKAEETRALGIEVGDFCYLDARAQLTEAGFVRSRHLDDKASVACIYGAFKAMADAGLTPAQRTTILITNFEEAGHGASAGIPADCVELLAVDMAAGGEGQNSDEFSCGICVKDSGGPYHIEMRRKLVELAQNADIPYKLDVYPFYNSDGVAALHAGSDLRVGLIGPGVDASHAYERTHQDSLAATARLIVEYLLAP